ncbi:pentatricopeptide repeat-containing protein At4g21705, mitochondrial-like [Tripterygium wilfordii]|uniref:pentatricopeptide repeat-containing protein At4g21705, mitochondrial-like n=1 Tax=Tripterygium wilfordii TaxID=458696 RepID=UPI0018F7F281|nr:pentatricopeptide repeat-containing protein At4g21705, mitochondrial-like [Tripterygium wilfordii]
MNSKLFSKTLIQFGRCYSTSYINKEALYSKISPLGNPATSLGPELDSWVSDGKEVRVAELQRIIRDLRKRKRFTQALQVSEWMNKNGICAFSPTEHAVQLNLIGRVHGYLSAENYFYNLRDEEKTDKTYGALLHCYVQQKQIDKALSHVQKMREMGFASSPLTYNDIMCLYANLGQHEKVPEILNEMKKNKISPDNLSYRICINAYVTQSNIMAMEALLKEMENQPHIAVDWNTYAVVANFYIKAGLTDKAIDALKKAEERLEKNGGNEFNHLMSLYASIGNKAEVLRLWDLQKSACRRHINSDYITMLDSLVKLGDVEEAEELLKEWESSGNCYDFRVPNIVFVGYSKKGLYKKAEVILKELMEKGKAITPNSWARLAEGYLDEGEMTKVVDCMKAAVSRNVESKEWKPSTKVITAILGWLGDEGSAEDVEACVASLRTVIPVSRRMYHALIKANIRGGKEVNGILESMKTDKINEDKETKKVLGLRV